ncbi:D-amino acid dehydrogenase small subunit [Polystyrenella longa]|uniref:D-amino acid dehydrogenase small subunit n=1 Tax=Polystyrenella longa TaxID=2528007 RepID=A0A518CKR2_9PLAN|nr:FAD-dependent oxidoreductase [Polystyrenella longa]QDU79807.1 D-amino acid dehydrogenase small subunit [Polystyrenella longa]
MLIRIVNIRLPVEEPEEALRFAIARRLEIKADSLPDWRILRKSLDARSRFQLKYVYSVVLDLPDAERHLAKLKNPHVSLYAPPTFEDHDAHPERLAHRPVVIGSGPAGLLAGYYLAWKGFQPLIIERGYAVKERVPEIRNFDRGGEFAQENNYLFGEGGAGCFSDGKLTCRMTGSDVDWTLERFIECGGRESILYEHRPHLGSNRLPLICRNFRRKIEAMGGGYKFGCRLESLDINEGRIVGIHTSSGHIKTNHLILAIGHSARDTYQQLFEQGVPFVQKAFQLGLRIEQPQTEINDHKYGHPQYLDLLGAADYTMNATCGDRDLYTFCMCAGGTIIPSISEPGMFCSNGMSRSRHDTPYGNSGLMVTLKPEEFGSAHPLAGIKIQQQYEAIAFDIAGRDYHSPIQRAEDFLEGRSPNSADKLDCSYERGVRPSDVRQVLPPNVLKTLQEGLPALDSKWGGDYLKNAILVGPEMRGSAPVRIDRDRDNRQCPDIKGLFPVGEGAGYAGGIVSAAVDGLRSARTIVSEHALAH